jgi:hypothetical protein
MMDVMRCHSARSAASCLYWPRQWCITRSIRVSNEEAAQALTEHRIAIPPVLHKDLTRLSAVNILCKTEPRIQQQDILRKTEAPVVDDDDQLTAMRAQLTEQRRTLARLCSQGRMTPAERTAMTVVDARKTPRRSTTSVRWRQ